MMHLRILSIIAVVLHAGSTATAGTLTVRRDGTGDFTVIQDAVNAAASGDTIRIGPKIARHHAATSGSYREDPAG
ncbi:MAG: hypothetical protein IPJ24_01300 [bacterium]|nr:hypothetical protein [bacterium]